MVWMGEAACWEDPLGISPSSWARSNPQPKSIVEVEA
jgi:hypothetical protein